MVGRMGSERLGSERLGSERLGIEEWDDLGDERGRFEGFGLAGQKPEREGKGARRKVGMEEREEEGQGLSVDRAVALGAKEGLKER